MLWDKPRMDFQGLGFNAGAIWWQRPAIPYQTHIRERLLQDNRPFGVCLGPNFEHQIEVAITHFHCFNFVAGLEDGTQFRTRTDVIPYGLWCERFIVGRKIAKHRYAVLSRGARPANAMFTTN